MGKLLKVIFGICTILGAGATVAAELVDSKRRDDETKEMVNEAVEVKFREINGEES